MTKRLKVIIVVGIISIIASLYGVDKLNSYQISKYARTVYIEMLYCTQNQAFELDNYTTCYLPYFETEESRKELQIKFNAFRYKTGREITVEDVKKFLEEPLNHDGSPRTFKDDNGVVGDYVEWYNTCNNYWNGYESDMIIIIGRYSERYNVTELGDLSDLSLDQINELSSHYTGDVNTYPYEQLHEEWS